MANLLLLKDRRKDSWGKVNARIIWSGGGQDNVWVDSHGIGEFNGTGTISYIIVAGETLHPSPRQVDGRTTVTAVSTNSH